MIQSLRGIKLPACHHNADVKLLFWASFKSAKRERLACHFRCNSADLSNTTRGIATYPFVSPIKSVNSIDYTIRIQARFIVSSTATRSESYKSISPPSARMATLPSYKDVPMVLNSLGNTKVPLLSRNNDKSLTWYICGPTVYDVSHLGHARNYVSFDIIRRILEDYFGYNITLQMNVTDIDDKIIKRSNEKNESFVALARRMEASFFKDFRMLNCKPPTLITRVSEYIPEIINYVEKIISHGFGYVSPSGSVYFDTMAFKNAGYNYLKLVPEAAGNVELLQEGEGVLSTPQKAATPAAALSESLPNGNGNGNGNGNCADIATMEKKCEADFAMWKASKPGEPSWPCPWTEKGGRPGWHIECSVMASSTLGCPIDLHSGGVDLKFPHHDNEIAQAEAYHECHEWVRIWMHSGHLHINGLKMSKSLKNFISIEASLQRYSSSEIRLFVLLHKYGAPLDYSEDSMVRVTSTYRKLVEFAGNMNAAIRLFEKADISVPIRPQNMEIELLGFLDEKKKQIHEALLDNFNTPETISVLLEIMNRTNVYVATMEERKLVSNGHVIRAVLDYVLKITKLYGLSIDSSAESNQSEQENTATVSSVLDILGEFRQTIRSHALDVQKNKAIDFPEKKEVLGVVLKECDNVRDEVLPALGVRFEDKPDGSFVWKQEDAATLLREIQRKKDAERTKAEEKEKKRLEEEEKKLAEMEKAKILPEMMFKQGQYASMYSSWDDKGIPLLDAEGKEVTKSAAKKLVKEQERQVALRAKYFPSDSKASS
mmetsp:Transcript_16773/g.29386  ORF Transcript_16773/g.29386 Transcript_16773/m.29386 type:complete len:772 (+) Transcript_16773:380-2695(+)